ncbi:GFA family protein [Spirochaeta isovalerica]|uniref:CENP-V/GFA domain-containing protein n=1 Tax=Spirochaeta isovalerica TaxID=150 RepID=A0A841REH2_9SPIO|nr:GFA family protein [Spirochaeta isovalerica]MBB6481781.1 hypothetical protein [Spirochaeta isovalerica]
MKYSGSCLCGNIKFEIHGTFESFFFCHCKSCRKDTGSAHGANLFSSRAELKWLKGEKEVKTFDYENSGHIKSFCPNCGSALPNLQMENKLVVVPAGSLDSDVDIKPTGHIYLEEKANWDENLERVPQFQTLPE